MNQAIKTPIWGAMRLALRGWWKLIDKMGEGARSVATQEMLRRLAFSYGLREALFADPRLAIGLASDRELLKTLASDPLALARLLSDPEVARAAGNHPMAAQAVLRNIPPLHAARLAPEWTAQLADSLNLSIRMEKVEKNVDRQIRETLIGKEWGALAPLSEPFRTLQWLYQLQPYLPKRQETKQIIEKMLTGDAPLRRETIVKACCDDTYVYLSDRRFRYINQRTLHVLFEEILVRQEYGFKTNKTRPTIIDGGTNIGLASFVFKEQYPDAQIMGFEPVPAIREIYDENMRNNGYKDVESFPYALSSEPGEATLYIAVKDMLAASLTTRRVERGDQVEKIKVPCKPLSHFLDRPIDFLKLDIEGAEYDALMEAASKLDQVEWLFCEYHHSTNYPRDYLGDILHILHDKHFNVHVSKTAWAEETQAMNPMQYVDKSYSLSIFAHRRKAEEAKAAA